MQFETVKKIVEDNPQVRTYGLNDWGEPLLHPDIVEIVRFLKSKGKQVYFATNAVLLNPEMSEALVKAGLDRIFFSVDGVGTSYEKIRGVPYELIKKNILGFISEAGLNTQINVVCVVSKDNEANALEVKREWQRYAQVYYQPQLLFVPDTRKQKCAELYGNHLVVLSDGTVVPCCADYEGELRLGNVNEHTLNEIENGPALAKLRKDSTGSFCGKCSEYHSDRVKPRFKTMTMLRSIMSAVYLKVTEDVEWIRT